MKKIVWANKSNGQLCITIPKDSGIREGDIVDLEKEGIRKVVYTCITGDLFHYGHLRLLHKASALGDFHVCGVLTDEAISAYKKAPIASLAERKAIIQELRCVDMMMVQHSLDPEDNLKQLHEQFPRAQIILVFGSNWKKVPGMAYVRKIRGQVIQPEFYEKLSTDNIVRKIFALYKEGK